MLIVFNIVVVKKELTIEKKRNINKLLSESLTFLRFHSDRPFCLRQLEKGIFFVNLLSESLTLITNIQIGGYEHE